MVVSISQTFLDLTDLKESLTITADLRRVLSLAIASHKCSAQSDPPKTALGNPAMTKWLFCRKCST